MTVAGRRTLRAGRAGAAAAAAALALCAAAPAASAAGWGYQQITPADSGRYDAYAGGVSEDSSTVFEQTMGQPMDGQPGDGRPGPYLYALRNGTVTSMSPMVDDNFATVILLTYQAFSQDGSRALFWSPTALLNEPDSGQRVYRWDAAAPLEGVTGSQAYSSNSVVATPDARTVAFVDRDQLIAYRNQDGALQAMSVDDAGNPMQLTAVGGQNADWSGGRVLSYHALADDGSSLIFESTDSLAGDQDGGSVDVYQRITGSGGDRTVLLSDTTPGAGADGAADAQYQWASGDQGTVIWRTTEALDPSDTDDAADLYERSPDGTVTLITKGESVDGSATGNAAAPTGDVLFSTASPDGREVFFVSDERLTQDAPNDAAPKLYVRDLDAGTTTFVAGPLDPSDVALGDVSIAANGSLTTQHAIHMSFRGIRITPWGAVFQSAAQLVPQDTDGVADIYAWRRGSGLQLVSAPQAGAPSTPDAAATWMPPDTFNSSGAVRGGRGVSDDGSRVFFTTAQSLTADDTDGGHDDVYAWSADTGTVTLVTPPGDTPADAEYIDSTADGGRVFIQTRESILPGDTDGGAVDTYEAILGGGSPPSQATPPVPAGPVPPAGALPGLGAPDQPGSSAPKAPEPAPPARHEGQAGAGSGSAPARAHLSVHVARRVAGHGRVTVTVRASTAGRLKLTGTSRLAKGHRSTVASADEHVAAGRTRLQVRLTRAALRRLRAGGALKVRFAVRLSPSGRERAATRHVTVKLRAAAAAARSEERA